MNLTRKRIAALLDLAGRGEDDLVLHWQDEWQIDITSNEAEIIQTVADEQWDEQTLREALEAHKLVRTYHEARLILVRRYIA